MNMYEKCTVHCTVYSVHFTLPTSHKVSIFENAPGRFVMSRYISRETCISGAAEQPAKWGCWVSGVQGFTPLAARGWGLAPRKFRKLEARKRHFRLFGEGKFYSWENA